MKALIAYLSFLLLLASGCTHGFSNCTMQSAERSIAFSELFRNPDRHIGKTVMAGGIVVNVTRESELTILEITQFELAPDGVPFVLEQSGGRFLATTAAPGLDLEPLVPGRQVTVIGEIKGKKKVKLGDADHILPVLSIKEVSLWPDVIEDERLLSERQNPYYWGYPDDRYRARPVGPVLRRD
ncbi:Slp family lipoprotein [Geobacter sp. DSM 9736]|uniref:Slp family lipoprotein n=1 Tax=Geobacter sp. DSM 9736 TaxID=1277350 RepID=UPI000B512C23|nr:Slp family lipoprotein [Geobacter sp. DSM 9736]